MRRGECDRMCVLKVLFLQSLNNVVVSWDVNSIVVERDDDICVEIFKSKSLWNLFVGVRICVILCCESIL